MAEEMAEMNKDIEQSRNVTDKDENLYECDICGKTFSRLSSVTRHKKTVHSKCASNENKETFQCRECNTIFTDISNRRRHEKKFHDFHPYVMGKLNCSECNGQFKDRCEILKHFQDCHPDIVLDKEERCFKCIEEFNIWKEEMEKDTAAYYIRRQSYKTKDSSVDELFICHRSGQFVSKSSGKRHLKVGGSHRSGFFCPSYVRAKTLPNGVVNITFVKTHVGHKCEVGHLPLSQSEKKEIAGLLHVGVPFQSVMNKIHEKASPTKRLAVTKVQDIRNVAQSFGLNLNCVRSESDVLSVNSWVKEMQSKENSPILCYKLPGELSPEFVSLETRDFLLGFMNETQEEILKIYGHEIISIDSTHGTNKYDIQLTSLVVKDDNWEGFPVAFLWSNRQSEVTFKYFFEAIKTRSGDIQTKTFMSDDYPAFYNAWVSVFPPAQFNLICDWHVKRAWRKNLTTGPHRVQNADKKMSVLGALDALSNEMDQYTFHELLNIHVSQWLEDPATSSFGKYFVSNYQNRPEQWAACYRVGANINTNMTIERWHRDLKYNSDLNGKHGGRLDKAIHSLIKSLRMKIMNRLSSIQRGKLTKRITRIRGSHKQAQNNLNTVNIFENAEDGWIVPSVSRLGETYIVKKNVLKEEHSCKIECEVCQICIHQFRCSCPDSAIKYNMCKHIHLVCLKNNVTNSMDTPEVEASDLTIDIDTDPVAEQEKSAIVREIHKSQTTSKTNEELYQMTESMVLGILSDSKRYTNEQHIKLQQMLTIARNTCNALESPNLELPPVAASSSTQKKIVPQRHFPLKKRRKVSDGSKSNHPDNLKLILESKAERFG